MRSILRFVFVVVPTAVLATAVVVGVSNRKSEQAVTADGDLHRDLQLASTASIELAPAGQAIATISAIESPRAPTAERPARAKRSRTSSRVVRSRMPTSTAAREPEVAAATDDAESQVTTDLGAPPADAAVETLANGGVALPRPTAIPVAYPTGGSDAGTYDPGPTVVRGGSIDPDHCQIHGRGRAGPPIFRQPRGPSLGDRIRGAQASTGSGERRSGSLGDRIRQASNSGSRSSGGSARSGSSSSSSSGGRTLGDRIRSARGR